MRHKTMKPRGKVRSARRLNTFAGASVLEYRGNRAQRRKEAALARKQGEKR